MFKRIKQFLKGNSERQEQQPVSRSVEQPDFGTFLIPEEESPAPGNVLYDLDDDYYEEMKKSIITSSERVEGLIVEIYYDLSGHAELNGEKIGKIDLETKEFKIAERDWEPMYDESIDDIKDVFMRMVENYAIKKGAKIIKQPAEPGACGGIA